MDTPKFSKVTVLERFDLGGKTYAPGTARIPTDKVAKLLEKKLILAEDSLDDGERLSGTALEAELLNVLAPHIAEHGENEGAVECLMRIVDERDEWQLKSIANQAEGDATRHKYSAATERAEIAETRNRDLQSQIEILRASVSGGQITGEGDSPAPSTPAVASEESVNQNETPESTPIDAKELTPIVGPKGALALINDGFNTREKIRAATDEQLDGVDGIAEKSIEKLRAAFAA